MALNPSGYLDICPRGHPGDPTETDRKSKTMNLKITNVLNYIQKVSTKYKMFKRKCETLYLKYSRTDFRI